MNPLWLLLIVPASLVAGAALLFGAIYAVKDSHAASDAADQL